MVLTFEKIRELYWIERDRRELQALPENFFQELREYIERKHDEQAKNVAKDLINRRIKKILESALIYVQTKVYPINLTEEEKILFEEIINVIRRFNEIIFESESPITVRKEKKEVKQNENKNDDVLITKDLPRFVGPDMKIYRLKKGDKIKLPKELKEFLAKKNVIAEGI
ncbi:MAG: DNA replication complex GINS family protein [Candidatus Aenigmarchaeota archaeon]|nr:DNA replication complex GINS family protein [Candidatus Aenigmarchaeota archaeon]